MKKSRYPSISTLLASAVVGVLMTGVGYFLGSTGVTDPVVGWFVRTTETLNAWDLFVLPVLVLLVLGVHELGHLLAGLSQGMRFLLLIFGPFQWHASRSGVKFRWVTHLGLMGGIAATIPTEVGPKLSRQLIVMISGGPTASLFLGVVAIVIAMTFDSRVGAYGAIVALSSLGIFLATAIPMRAAGFMSDGMQILDVLSGKQSVVERTTLLQISAQSLAGVRPRDWDSEAIRKVAQLTSDEPLRQISAWQLLLLRSSDCGDASGIKKYGELLAANVDRFPDGFRQAIHAELAICAGLAGKLELAKNHLSNAKGGVVEPSRRFLAAAIIATLEQSSAQAIDLREKALRSLNSTMDPGVGKLTRDQILALAE